MSRGNRGGIFLHARPDLVPDTAVMAVDAPPVAARRLALRKTLTRVGSLLAIPALAKALLLFADPPAPVAATLADYQRVWSGPASSSTRVEEGERACPRRMSSSTRVEEAKTETAGRSCCRFP